MKEVNKSLGFLETTKGKLEVFEKNGRFYYFSKRAMRKFPIAKKDITFSEVI